VVGDHRHPFADFWPSLAPRNIHLRMLLAQHHDPRIGIFEHVAVPAVPCRQAQIAAKSFCPTIENDLVFHGITDDGANQARRAILQLAISAPKGVHVVENISAGSDLGVLLDQMRSENSRG